MALAVGLLLAGAEPESWSPPLSPLSPTSPALPQATPSAANVTLLTLILGSLALARPVQLGQRIPLYAAGVAVASAAAWWTLTDAGVSRPEGWLWSSRGSSGRVSDCHGNR